jgi:hypothetical protein
MAAFGGGTTTTLTVDAWEHVALSYTTGTDNVKLYLNGVNFNSGTAGAQVSNEDDSLMFGGHRDREADWDSEDGFKGYLDDIRVWDGVRTASEISANKQVSLRGDEEGLVSYWRMDNNLNDSAGLGSPDNFDNALTEIRADPSCPGSSADNIAYAASTAGVGDPIVLDLNGDGVTLVDRSAGARFDITGDGKANATSWMGADDGLLAMDVNGDGVINGMSEVFSDAFGDGYANSMRALTSLDSNADGVIDSGDDRYDDILVWKDADTDGVSASSELIGLSGHGISAIDLDVESTAENTAGSHIDARGTFVYDDGTTGTYVEATFGFSDSVETAPGVTATEEVAITESFSVALASPTAPDGTTTSFVSTGIGDASVVGEVSAFAVDLDSSAISAGTVVVTALAGVEVEAETDSEGVGVSSEAEASDSADASTPAAVPIETDVGAESAADPGLEEEIDGYVVYPTAALAAVAVTEPIALAA